MAVKLVKKAFGGELIFLFLSTNRKCNVRMDFDNVILRNGDNLPRTEQK